MTEAHRPAANGERGESPAGGDEYARAYSEGYGEGLREALREMLQHASRGHTAQELRLLVESRLARVREDVELKRRSLTNPPNRPAWGAILRPPSPTLTPPPSGGAPRSLDIVAGGAYLFREQRPERAVAAAGAAAGRFPRLVAISVRPPSFSLPPGTSLEFVEIRVSGDPDERPDPTRISGRIRTAVEAEGGALVYLDAVETLAGEAGINPTLKFVSWLTQLAAARASAVVVSVDPATLDPRSMSLLERSFPSVL